MEIADVNYLLSRRTVCMFTNQWHTWFCKTSINGREHNNKNKKIQKFYSLLMLYSETFLPIGGGARELSL